MILEIIQDVANALKADPYFTDIAVFSEDLGDPSNSIDIYLAKKTGIGVQIVTPKLRVTKPDKGGNGLVYYDDIIFWATVWENVKLNRGSGGTMKPAVTVAETVSSILHHYKPSFAIENLTLNAQGISILPHPQLLAYRIGFTTQGGCQYSIAKISTPTLGIVDNGNGTKTVTITCTTAHAFVYYTTDGSYPAPLQSNGSPRTPYASPFIVSTGTKVQVRAWLPGLLTSDFVTQSV